ncbi:MAG: deacylase [Epsilonproteobacteria bacterium]|nr:deacylase [Campylobacterota bacterium]
MLRLFSVFIFGVTVLFGQHLDFTLIKKGDPNSKNVLLVVGGIQGDEPGGFMAASLFSTHYKITKGAVWIVPNFNFYSIIKRNRGPFGDLNRKFVKLKTNDPDYNLIERMKKIIENKKITMVVNLHDGSGFYRTRYIDKLHQPRKWGQASIIDQDNLKNIKYGNLKKISDEVVAHVNKHLIKKEHKFRTKNTKTHIKKTFEEKEMSKTLTFYAINQGKAAFGNESSKSLPVNERVYYKLLSLEKFMDIMGIKYKRKFPLNPLVVKDIIDNDIFISFNDKKIFIPLSGVRKHIRYFPLEKGAKFTFKPSSPVMTVLQKRGRYIVYYGNRKLTTLVPEYLKYDKAINSVKVNIDGKVKNIKFGTLNSVKNYFNVKADKRYRVNVIGYINRKHKNEVGLNIRKKQIIRRYSIDKYGKRYRVEVYDAKQKNKFLGMFLIEFNPKKKKAYSIVALDNFLKNK